MSDLNPQTEERLQALERQVLLQGQMLDRIYGAVRGFGADLQTQVDEVMAQVSEADASVVLGKAPLVPSHRRRDALAAVLILLKKHGQMSRPDLGRRIGRKFTKVEIDAALDLIAMDGKLKTIKVQPEGEQGPAKGRPKLFYALTS